MVYQKEDSQAVYSVLHRSWFGQKGGSKAMRILAAEDCGEQLMLEEIGALKQSYPEISDSCWEIWGIERKKCSLSRISEYLNRNHIQLHLIESSNYPVTLKNVSDPPALLYCKGESLYSELSIGVVGSRMADDYGKSIAEQIGKDLSKNGICVVSGLAKGIDTYAHKGALEGQGGTIAVLGCGLDKIYPSSNKTLAERILEHERGCMISEFPLGSKSDAWHFPKRNRIISGLSLGVVVVQAGEKSGVYSTVESALNQGKDVFAVPGNVLNPLSHGPNLFIKEGAMLIESARDILAYYGMKYMDNAPEKQSILNPISSDFSSMPENIILTDEEKSVLLLFQREPLSVESLLRLSGMRAGDLTAILSMLEIHGLIQHQGGRNYIRIR